MDLQSQTPLTGNFINAGAVAGTTNSFTTTEAITPVIAGKYGTALGVLTNSATTPTTDANTGATFATILPNTTAAVVFGVNAGYAGGGSRASNPYRNWRYDYGGRIHSGSAVPGNPE